MENKTFFAEFDSADKNVWLTEALKIAKSQNIAVLQTNTYEDIALQPFYTTEDLSDKSLTINQLKANNNWENREAIKGDNSLIINQLAQEALSKGADSVFFDLSQIEKPDLSIILQGLDLQKFGIGLKIRTEIQNFLNQLKGFSGQIVIDYDFLADWTISGEIPENAWENLSELLKFSQNQAELKALKVNGLYFNSAGANAIQELAFTLAMAVEYLDKTLEKGFSPSLLFKNIEISLAIGNQYFMEIAKFRAIRILWQQIQKAFGVENHLLALHAQTGTWNKTNIDAYNNMLRSTTEAMSAVIGGANSLSISPYNEVFSGSDNFARRIARNISTILKNESHLDKIADASAGAYYLENLTENLVEKAWQLFQEVEKRGGFVQAFQQGFISEEIEKVANLRKQNFRDKKDILVGVNKYENKNEKIELTAQKLAPNNSNLKLLNINRLEFYKDL